MLLERLWRRAPISAALIGLLLAASTGAQAADSGPSQPVPIDIHSDHADFTQKTGVSTYTGHVRMTRAGLTLTGKKLVVTRLKNRSQIKAVLTGDPAHIHKTPDADDNEVVTGHARQIVYTNADGLITLRGDAEVTRDGDRVQGPVITHSIRTGATHAESAGSGQHQQVHITIQPASVPSK